MSAPYDPERITYFAKTDARGQQVPFGIKAKDRTRHMYVIGKSGMGKSTLLENLAVQDIQNGEGFAFIDPHGQSAEALLDFIPEERLDDVLYFNPSDLSHPVAFNVLEDVEPDKRFLVVSGLMSVFKKIWVDAWSARMEYLLQYTLMALLEHPGATLLGVNRMLSEKGYREEVLKSVTDPAVRAFWLEEYAKYSERYAQEAGDSIKNKIGQFTSNPVIRNIIGQERTSFDLRQFMDKQKIFIANLSKGLTGETNANLLGSMLTTRIYLAAMSRADLSPREMANMPNFYFYVDEFQSFANATFAGILSEARKYKLNLTIAHQYIDQMEEDVRNAVFGNVGTTISFRVGPMDGEVLEKIFMPQFTATDLVNLSFAQIYLTLMIDGIGTAPFSAVTLPPIKQEHASYRDMALARSRAQFASPREEIEEKVNTFYATTFESNKQDTKKRIKAPGKGEKKDHEKTKEDLREILRGMSDGEKQQKNDARGGGEKRPEREHSDRSPRAPRRDDREAPRHAKAPDAKLEQEGGAPERKERRVEKPEEKRERGEYSRKETPESSAPREREERDERPEEKQEREEYSRKEVHESSTSRRREGRDEKPRDRGRDGKRNRRSERGKPRRDDRRPRKPDIPEAPEGHTDLRGALAEALSGVTKETPSTSMKEAESRARKGKGAARGASEDVPPHDEPGSAVEQKMHEREVKEKIEERQEAADEKEQGAAVDAHPHHRDNEPSTKIRAASMRAALRARAAEHETPPSPADPTPHITAKQLERMMRTTTQDKPRKS